MTELDRRKTFYKIIFQSIGIIFSFIASLFILTHLENYIEYSLVIIFFFLHLFIITLLKLSFTKEFFIDLRDFF